MRSRSFPERAGLVLGAAVEGIWSGALAAALVGASGYEVASREFTAPLLIVFAAVVVLVAAVLARRFAAGEAREHRARLLALTLVLVVAAALLIGGRAWMRPFLLWQVVRDVVYSGGLVALGLHLDSTPQSPETAVRRAVRAFALLCAVLAVAALAGSVPSWAPRAVVAALVAGGLLVAIVRYETLTDLVEPAERLPVWPWLLAVLGAVLAVVAVGALLSEVLRPDVVLTALSALAAVLRYALAGAAYLVGSVVLELGRGIAWLLGALHLHAWRVALHRRTIPQLALRRRVDAHGIKLWKRSGLAASVVGAIAAVALSFALVVVALRRFSRRPAPEVMVVEERETLVSVRSAAGELAARLVRRLRRRLLGPRRPEARTPAELVRRRYAELERRLARGGWPRPLGVTVRDHLTTVAAATPATGASDEPVASIDAQGASSSPAADLAVIYETARYSAHAVDVAQAGRFEALAQAFMA